MMLGMGTVFVFLGLLVLATFGLSKLVEALGLAHFEAAATSAKPTSSQSELEGVTAAAAAVHRARGR